MDTFTETQRFRQWWVWILMGFVTLVVLGSIITSSAWQHPKVLLGILPLLLIIIFLYIQRLDTRLDKKGIHYRVFPILPWRTIPWNAIQAASVREYSFVGYGIRWGFEGWVYNVAGNKGLRVVFPDKHQIIIGTQRPDEMQAFLTIHETSLKN